MKITIGSDHDAVELKDAVKKVLAELNCEVNVYSAKKSREHNAANVVAMGVCVLGFRVLVSLKKLSALDFSPNLKKLSEFYYNSLFFFLSLNRGAALAYRHPIC